MSDREIRRILTAVMEDLDTGRLRLRSPLRLVRRAMAPVVLAASLGLAACDSEAVGSAGERDAGPDARPDVYRLADATYAAPFDVYLPQDAAPAEDADLTDASVVDSGPIGVYLAPPPVDPE
jgi:hypothetical protein